MGKLNTCTIPHCLSTYVLHAYNADTASLKKVWSINAKSQHILDVCTCLCLLAWVIFESGIQCVPDGRQPFVKATSTCLTWV